MGISTVHTIGLIDVNGSSGYQIYGIEDCQVNPNLSEIMLEAAGQPDPTFVATMSAAPTITATVNELAVVLAKIGLNGMCFPQTTTYTTVDFFFTKVTCAAPRGSGSTHFKVTMNSGIAIPKTITANQNAHATLGLEFHAIYDGTNDPFVFTDNQAIQISSISEAFTVGKVSINGSTVDGVTGISIDFGIDVIKESSGGDVYPTFVGIGVRRPRITVTTKTIPSISTFTLDGTAQTSTDSVIYLQKIAEGGARVAAATAEHISFTIDEGEIWCGPYGGGNNASSEGQIIIQPTYDGTAAILVINTATAIT